MSCNLSGLSELELLFHNQSYGHPVVRWPSQKLCIDYYDALGCHLLLHQVKISDMISLQQITALTNGFGSRLFCETPPQSSHLIAL